MNKIVVKKPCGGAWKSLSLLLVLGLLVPGGIEAGGLTEPRDTHSSHVPLLDSLFWPKEPVFWFKGPGIVLDIDTPSVCQPELQRATLVPLSDRQAWQLFITFAPQSCGFASETSLELHTTIPDAVEKEREKIVFLFSPQRSLWETSSVSNDHSPHITFQNQTELVMNLPFSTWPQTDELLWALHLFSQPNGLVDRLPNSGVVLEDRAEFPHHVGRPLTSSHHHSAYRPPFSFSFGARQQLAILLLFVAAMTSILLFIKGYAFQKKNPSQLAKAPPKT